MQRTPTVGVVIIDSNKVLLVKHGEGAGHLTGSMGLPGGRIDAGESSLEAAIREAKEETGLIVKAEDLIEIPHKYEADLQRKDGSILYVSHKAYATNKYSGELIGTSEAVPIWVEIGTLNDSDLLVNTNDMIKRALEVLQK